MERRANYEMVNYSDLFFFLKNTTFNSLLKLKNILFYFALFLVTLSSCSEKNYTKLYHNDSSNNSKDTKYHLPKNLLKFEITYTLNEPGIQKGSYYKVLNANDTKITINDPIVITNMLVADTSKTFVFTGEKIPQSAFKNDKNSLTQEKTSIPFLEDKNHKTPLFSFFTTSNAETEAYNAVLKMQDSMSVIKTKKEAQLALEIISFYKSQFVMLNENFHPYVKQYKIKYTVVLDPLKLYSNKNGNSSKIDGNKISHTIFPYEIFKDKGVLNDTVTFTISKPNTPLLSNFLDDKPIEGIIYKTSSPLDVEILLNDYSLSKNTLAFTQSGTFKTIAIKEFKKANSIVLFDSEKTENIPKFEEKLEELNFDSTAITKASKKAIRNEYKEKLKNINLLLQKLKKRKEEF